MKLFKKNQIIIYVIVLMLMTAGYLNYTTNTENQNAVETSMQMEASDDMQLADIGDATLVNSNDVVTENKDNTSNATDNTTETSSNNVETNVTTNTTNKEEAIQKETAETSSSNSNDYFVKSKLERDTMYSQMIETYEKVLNSTNLLETQRQSATQEIQKINDTKNSIMIFGRNVKMPPTPENLIRTKGFENNIIFVNGDSVSIIIGVAEIKPEEIAQIQNIISREMKAEIENIHIATK